MPSGVIQQGLQVALVVSHVTSRRESA
jgi:hypothetical protein